MVLYSIMIESHSVQIYKIISWLLNLSSVHVHVAVSLIFSRWEILQIVTW